MGRYSLARWVEAEFGVQAEAGGRLRRRVPRTFFEHRVVFASHIETDNCPSGDCLRPLD